MQISILAEDVVNDSQSQEKGPNCHTGSVFLCLCVCVCHAFGLRCVWRPLNTTDTLLLLWQLACLSRSPKREREKEKEREREREKERERERLTDTDTEWYSIFLRFQGLGLTRQSLSALL